MSPAVRPILTPSMRPESMVMMLPHVNASLRGNEYAPPQPIRHSMSGTLPETPGLRSLSLRHRTHFPGTIEIPVHTHSESFPYRLSRARRLPSFLRPTVATVLFSTRCGRREFLPRNPLSTPWNGRFACMKAMRKAGVRDW